MKIDSFEKYRDVVKLILKIKYKRTIIKKICNQLSELGITDAPKYTRKGSFSCYQVMRNIYKNFLAHGIAAIFDLRTINMTKDNFSKDDWKQKRKEIREQLNDKEKDDLIDMYEEIIEIDSNEEKFKKIYEIYKKDTDKNNCLALDKMCILMGIDKEQYDKEKPVLDKILKDVDLSCCNDPSILFKPEIYEEA